MKTWKILTIPALALLVACSSDEVDRLTSINEQLKTELRQRDVSMNDFLADVEDVRADLRDITMREGLLDGLTVSDSELSNSTQEEIMEDIALVDGLIKKNQEKIESLELKVKRSDGRLYEFERMVANLKMDIIEREEEILAFKNQLISMEAEYEQLLDDYHEQYLISTLQDKEMHKAYFAYGSKREFVEMSIAEKEGGILGIGVTWKLKDDFNKEYFQEVDMRELAVIPLESDNLDMLSTHPTDSYEVIEEDDRIKELVITDPNSFWSNSRYLAVLVE